LFTFSLIRRDLLRERVCTGLLVVGGGGLVVHDGDLMPDVGPENLQHERRGDDETHEHGQ